MTSFLNNLRSQGNLTRTENNAVTNASSLDPIVDFFGIAGAMRTNPAGAVPLFQAAYLSDPQTALRVLFYLRDVRGGQGEREVFRICMTWLYDCQPEAYRAVLEHIPFYGRWDDIFHAGVTASVRGLIDAQWERDLESYHNGESVSLMAKWLPSENASSPRTKSLARQVMGDNISSRDYRLTLSALRARIRLLEQDMSTSNWDEIAYDKIPSQAHRRHVKAFQRHTPERYQNYLDSVKAGEKKINVKTVYPHEIYTMVNKGETDYANVAWDALPDYTRGDNALVMADTSQSMVQPFNPANPIAVSVSLALYFAERNRGVFHNNFMIFSAEPKLIQIRGSTLQQKMQSIAHFGYQSNNTNLLAAFRAILAAGKHVPDEMPKVLYVISDMEFDSATGGQQQQQYQIQTQQVWVQTSTGGMVPMRTQVRVPIVTPATSNDTVFNTAKAEYAAAGLTLPHVVFWNVQARQTQAPATTMDGQVSLVSGLSPTIFSQAVEGKSPRELVDSVVNSERYQRITL